MDTYSRKKVVDKYSLIRTTSNKVMKNYAKEIIKYAQKSNNILEIGFGTGALIIPLTKLNKNSKILGVDKSKNMVLEVKKQIGNLASVYTGTLSSLLKEVKIQFNIIHFKAILHCRNKPEEEMDLISDSILPGGYLITGHEISQTEDRIEQIFEYKSVDDSEIESVFKYYFKLRKEIKKPFIKRKFPAGDSWNACKYFIEKKNFKLVEEISNDKLSWKKKLTIREILVSMKDGTFGVFYNGLTQEERIFLYKQLINFTEKNKIDIDKVRTIPARYKIYVLKNRNQNDN